MMKIPGSATIKKRHKNHKGTQRLSFSGQEQ